MKKSIIPFLLAFIIAFFTGCNNTNSGNPNSGSSDGSGDMIELKSLEEVLNTMSESDAKCDVYDADKYLAPIWENQIIYNETVMFRADENGEVKEKKLAYPIEKKSTGFYQLLEFKAEPAVVEKLELNFRRDERVIRYITVKLDKYAAEYAAKRKSVKQAKAQEV